TFVSIQRDIKRGLQKRLEAVIQDLVEKPFRRRRSIHDRMHFCQCDTNTIGFFVKNLFQWGLWPLTEKFENMNLYDILYRLESGSFKGPTFGHPGCRACELNISMKVTDAIEATRKAFEGLYLECIKNSTDEKDIEHSCTASVHRGLMSYESAAGIGVADENVEHGV
ncbi:hypothetical protein MMC18_009504, partial [Xylographa bjoerkii]|nr:hypothetical protein [Xylographa bjoerkii]MCJ1396613.1 hypothetical protein [Xylographa bjoerkii]